jgi:hypothetical protein
MDNNMNGQLTSTEQLTNLEQLYIDSLTEKEKQALSIAKKMLSKIFILKRTNGYLNWLKKQEEDTTIYKT